MGMHRLGNSPGNGTVIGDANDEALFSRHQWRCRCHSFLALVLILAGVKIVRASYTKPEQVKTTVNG
jgi:hypothetical protein